MVSIRKPREASRILGTGNTNGRERLNTVDLIKVAHLVKKSIMFTASKAAYPNLLVQVGQVY